MKIKGQKVSGSYVETVVFPRQTGDLVFRAQAVTNFENFDKLCPAPKPPVRMYPGGREVQDIEHPDYVKSFEEWAELKVHWMMLESLKATPDLEWETVVAGDHVSWKNYQKEMEDAGITPAEQARLVQIVSIANGLDQTKIDEATESFLADQARQALIANSQDSVPSATPSGEPASVSA